MSSLITPSVVCLVIVVVLFIGMSQTIGCLASHHRKESQDWLHHIADLETHLMLTTLEREAEQAINEELRVALERERERCDTLVSILMEQIEKEEVCE